jgi:hypothetical protein
LTYTIAESPPIPYYDMERRNAMDYPPYEWALDGAKYELWIDYVGPTQLQWRYAVRKKVFPDGKWERIESGQRRESRPLAKDDACRSEQFGEVAMTTWGE